MCKMDILRHYGLVDDDDEEDEDVEQRRLEVRV